jgi:inner membrane protein
VSLLQTFQTSVFAKVLFIGALVLMLLIPLGMIRGLIVERAARYESARAEVAGTWGEAQTVGGPILVVPFRFSAMSFGQTTTLSDELYLLPDELEIESDANVQKLKRGIYEVPVYDATVRVNGQFTIPDLSASYDDLEMLWDQAQFALPIGDARSIKEAVRLTSGAASTVFQPGGTRVAGFGPQLVARYAELGRGAPSAPLLFSLDLTLGGSSSLNFLPLGGVTRAAMKSNWASPSFGGAYLPERRAVTAEGFTASWRVLDIGRSFAAPWKRSDGVPVSVDATSFGASLITPIGVHAASLRSAKYGVLLIGLTFAAYFLFELFAHLRLHALQYLLIGIANCVFYLLLLALAEQIGFALAYAASAIASTTLISTYSAAVLRSMRRAAPIGALLGTVYAYLYVTLRAEDYALLFGSLGTFAALATFMHFTRHVDWHDLHFGPRAPGDGVPAQRRTELRA